MNFDNAQVETPLPNSLNSMPAGGFDALRFAGYAALFDVTDAGGDTLKKGAFASSLDHLRVSGEALPLLWQHRVDQPIGWIERIGEDDRGLRVVARLDNTDSLAAKMLRERKLSGLSFGYKARATREISLSDGRKGRELAQVDIFEISLVTRPMQHGARVHLIS